VFTANGRHTQYFPDGADVRIFATLVSSGSALIRIEDADDAATTVTGEWDDLRFPAQGINPTGGVADPSVDSVEGSFPGTLLFSASATNMIAGVAQLPHAYLIGSDLRPHIHWAKTTSASGNVVWHFYYRIWNRNGVADAWVGPSVGSDEIMTGDIADREGITTFDSIPGALLSLSHMMSWKIYRIGGDGADTYGGEARLLEFDIHLQKDSSGSGAEFLK
jgi:hypothetical protein